METLKPGTASANQNRSYEEFDPPLEWVKEEASDTLLVFLPGFQKEKLRIQITSAGKLRISGERSITQNKWRRFSKEFELDPNSDTSKITAKFEGGILYVYVAKPTTNNTATQPPRRAPTPKPAPPPASAPPTPTPIQKQQPDQANAKKDQTQHTVNNAAAQADLRRKELLDKKAAPSDDHDHDQQQKKKMMMPSTAAPQVKPQKKLEWADYDDKNKAKEKEKEKEKASDKASGESSEGLAKKETVMSSLQSLPLERVKKIGARRFFNSALAVLFVGVLALYVRNIFIRTFSGDEDNSSEL